MDSHSEERRIGPLAKLFSKKTKMRTISKEDIMEMIHEGNASGAINETAKEMLYGVFEFNDKVASEVMTPRVEVLALEQSMDLKEMIHKVIEENYTRIPIYEEDIHNIIGILNVKELLAEAFRVGVEKVDLKSLLKEPYLVPETKKIQRLFKELQHTKNRMAILKDEYGDFSGIVTVEDIVEEIVGDMVDENETFDEQEISPLNDGSYLVDGLTHIDDLNRQLKLDIQCENFDTIGGLVVHLLGSIPTDIPQVSVTYNNIVFEVKKVKANRVEQLRILLPKHIAV